MSGEVDNEAHFNNQGGGENQSQVELQNILNRIELSFPEECVEFIDDISTLLANPDLAEVKHESKVALAKSLGGIMAELLKQGDVQGASEVYNCFSNNVETILSFDIPDDDLVQVIEPFLHYAIPDNYEEFNKPSWKLVTKVMDFFAKKELVGSDYLTKKNLAEHRKTLVDELLINLIKKDEVKYRTLIIALLHSRYGFSYKTSLGVVRVKEEEYVEPDATEEFTHSNKAETVTIWDTYGEASRMLQIWEDCDGAFAYSIEDFGNSPEARFAWAQLVTTRRAQKIRRNLQVLETLRATNDLKVARKLRRTNGIVNFNRLSLTTLYKQYAYVTAPNSTHLPDENLKALSVLPQSDYNGAHDVEHIVLNNSDVALDEIIIEAGSDKSALVRLLRTIKGTSSKQRKERAENTKVDLYPTLPFEYIFVYGHGKYESVELGALNAYRGRTASRKLDMGLLDKPFFYTALKEHGLINEHTYIVLRSCNTAAESPHKPSGYNFASLLKRRTKVADVIAIASLGYADQKCAIGPDKIPYITQTEGPNKTQIVSIRQLDEAAYPVFD